MTIYSDLDPKTLFDELLNKYKVVYVPTSGGWYSSNSGSGATATKPMRLYLNTGTTASSRALFWVYAVGLNSGDMDAHIVDYSKYLECRFAIIRFNSDSEAVAHLQLKQVNTEGDLADVGIGLRIDNLDVSGEAYGTARQTVSLGTLTDGRLWNVRIVLIPGVRVEFWINGVLVGTLTGTAVPVGVTTSSYLVASIINGPTGGVNAVLEISNILLVQEW